MNPLQILAGACYKDSDEYKSYLAAAKRIAGLFSKQELDDLDCCEVFTLAQRLRGGA